MTTTVIVCHSCLCRGLEVQSRLHKVLTHTWGVTEVIKDYIAHGQYKMPTKHGIPAC